MHTVPAYPRRRSLATLVRMTTEEIILPSIRKGLLNLVLKAAIILAAVYATHLVLEWATTQAEATANDASVSIARGDAAAFHHNGEVLPQRGDHSTGGDKSPELGLDGVLRLELQDERQ